MLGQLPLQHDNDPSTATRTHAPTRLPHLYDNHMMEKYKGAALGELSPHPFAVADSAYGQMINEGISQSILNMTAVKVAFVVVSKSVRSRPAE